MSAARRMRALAMSYPRRSWRHWRRSSQVGDTLLSLPMLLKTFSCQELPYNYTEGIGSLSKLLENSYIV